jgi:autotransporter-associated beta strand protein
VAVWRKSLVGTVRIAAARRGVVAICVATAFAAWLLDAGRADAAILSAKRGFADTGANYNNLQATGAGWYYTWGTGVGNPGNFDANHYPMFWSVPSQGTIDNVKNRNPQYVLGFNEPERPDQANLTVAQAISSWTTISNSFAGSSAKLVSPAVSDTGAGQQWLASFMNQAAANNLRVDAVAFHWYGVSTPNDPAGAANSFLSRVDSYYNSYNKPVFITEFAIHDWGGAYTDAEIIEANRQFLNIVVPALESRSYVAGYAWYHWFGDSPLYSGNPSKPTEMGYKYVGAVETGQVANIAGQNLGEHVAYLAGGELTMTSGTAGTVKFINALEKTSTISGGIDWGLTRSNWVRIQPEATLRKAGTNEITLAGALTFQGQLEVTQGTLIIASSATGGGSARVKGGTLALSNQGRLNQAPLIDVQSGATFDVSGVNEAYSVTANQTLNVERNATVVGDVTTASASMFTASGSVTGSVSALGGSTIRVGKDGAGVATRFVIDNFESYALGDVRTNASPPWTAHQDTSLADVENFGGNKVLTYGWAGGARGVSRTLSDAAVIENSETATLFFRINSKTDDPDHNVGLGDQASTATADFADFEAQLRLKQGTTADTFALDARNGGAFTATLSSGLAINSWYNLWMVVNQTTDTYDLYMNTGTGAATAGNKLNTTPLAFRNGTANPLQSILAISNSAPIDNGVRVDDFTYLTGFDLTNPVAGFDPGIAWTAETLSVGGNYTQELGATLQIDLKNPAEHDVLDVVGQLNLGGTLHVGLAVGAASFAADDEFDILKFGALTGVFDSVVLPALGAGLVWDNSRLLTEGVLAVAVGVPGDFNGDGSVDAADYTVWRDSNGEVGAGLAADGNRDLHVDDSDYALWKASYGASLNGGGAEAAAVPEPASLTLLAVLLVSASTLRPASRKRGPF